MYFSSVPRKTVKLIKVVLSSIFLLVLPAQAAKRPLLVSSMNLPLASSTVSEGHWQGAKPEDPKTCVRYRTESLYVVGFNHWVHITNTCKATVSCRVSTNINPKIIKTSLTGGQEVSLLTYRGSSAAAFKASVICDIFGKKATKPPVVVRKKEQE